MFRMQILILDSGPSLGNNVDINSFQVINDHCLIELKGMELDLRCY